MNQSKTMENGYELLIRTSTIRLAQWNGAWGAATALMAFGPKFLWNKTLVFTLLAVGLDVAVGVGMILATKKYVLGLDELQQKVYLNALGIAVGVIPFKADIAHLVILMGLTFFVSFLYGARRYR